MGIKFLDELASYYLEVDLKQKELKHALSGLLVELLTPVAAVSDIFSTLRTSKGLLCFS